MENELIGEKRVVTANKTMKYVGIGLMVLAIVVLISNFSMIGYGIKGIIGPILAAGFFGYSGFKTFTAGNGSLDIHDNGMIINHGKNSNTVMFSEIEGVEYREERVLPTRKIPFYWEYAYLTQKNGVQVKIPFSTDSELKKELSKIETY